MKALVLSGGGSAGPFHLGALERLYALGHRYDMYVGVSVGALISSFLAMYPSGQETKGLLECRKLFLRVKNRNIWKHWSGGIFTSILPWLNKHSLYNSSPLERLARKTLSEPALRASDKQLLVGAVSLTTGKYRVFDKSFPHITEAVLASASYPVFFKPIEIDGQLWSDGGLRNVTPIKAALDAGATEVHCVTCVPQERGIWKGGGVLDVAGRALSLVMDEVVSGDLESYNTNVPVTIWQAQSEVVADPLGFYPGEAKLAYQKGYYTVRDNPGGTL